MKRVAFITDRPMVGALRALNYTPEVERIRRASQKKSIVLQELCSAMGPGYGSVFTRVDCSPAAGVELLSQSDMLSAGPRGRIIRRDSMPNPAAHEISRFNILIAGAGTLGETELYGRSIIADNRIAKKYVGPDSMSLICKEPNSDVALFAYAFLITETGVRAVRSTSYGTKILRFRKDLLGTLPVPLGDDRTVKGVASLIRVALEKRESYAAELRRAQLVIEKLPAMRDAAEMYATRTARAVMWSGSLDSLSAWNVASGGGSLALLKRAWRARLRDVLIPNGAFNGPRFSRIDCQRPHGINFMSQRDVFLMRPVPRRIAAPSISDRMLFVPEESILVGSHGQLSEGSLFGRVELGSYVGLNCGVTQDILRLVPREGKRATLFAYLATTVGQAMLKATAVGTSIPSMRIDLLLDLPCPDLDDDDTRLVEKHLAAAETSRLAAAKAESEAIEILDEEVLPTWLE